MMFLTELMVVKYYKNKSYSGIMFEELFWYNVWLRLSQFSEGTFDLPYDALVLNH